jgi:hypothetical protein
MDEHKISRPEKVGTAVKLLYIVLGILALQDVLLPSKHLLKSIIFGMFTILGPMWFLIYKTSKGRNWARIILLVWFIGGSLRNLLKINSILLGWESNLLIIMLEIAIGISWAVAMFFLFQKPSSDWFKAMKSKT